MHHTAAFVSSIADITLAEVTPLADQIMRIQNNHFTWDADLKLLYAAFLCASGNRARIVTPSLRILSTPWVRPIRLALVPAAEPRVADYRPYPLRIKAYEEIAFEAFQTSGGAAEAVGIIGLDFGQSPLPPGEPTIIRGTSTTAAVADAWTQIAVTWQDALQPGNYVCCGLEVQSANARAARLNFTGQYPRPGSISVTAIGDLQHNMFRCGGLGAWGYFKNYLMPNVEVLCNAADAAHELYMSIIKL